MLIAGLVYHNYDPASEIIEMSGGGVAGQWGRG